MKKIAVLVLSVSSLIVISCSKDEANQTKTPADYLTAKDWMLTEASYTITIGGKDSIVSIFLSIPACQRDNLRKFETSKVVTEKCGATKCTPSDPNSVPAGMWELISNNTQLRIIDSDTTDANIRTLNATTFKFNELSSGMNILMTYTAQ